MSKFNKITADAFEKLQLGAGIVCTEFTPDKPAAVADEKIMFATSGGVSFTATPTYTDYGEDVDNCPANMKEMKNLEGFEAKLSGTALTLDTSSATKMVGAADASGNKVSPRNELKDSDFSDIWWVGEYGKDGCVAINLINALSTGGFSLQTGDKSKGQFAFEFTGHYSIETQDTPPFDIYIVKTATQEAAEQGQPVSVQAAYEEEEVA